MEKMTGSDLVFYYQGSEGTAVNWDSRSSIRVKADPTKSALFSADVTMHHRNFDHSDWKAPAARLSNVLSD